VSQVAALYVDKERGPYPELLGSDLCWGRKENAKRYLGTLPVVAHPPCGPWGSMRQFSYQQDRSCGPRAVAQVLRWGGVLEHPSGSILWKFCGLERTWSAPPLVAGRAWSLMVDQVRWGHPCRKKTRLLIVGVPPHKIPPIPPSRDPTHYIGGPKEWRDTVAKQRGLRLLNNKKIGHLTPIAFARWLIAIAEQAGSEPRRH
jgi:hypothetical protein